METQESATSKYGKRYSQAEKDDILGRYRASGLKLDTFARQAGIGPWTLKRWLGRWRTTRRQKLVAVQVGYQEPEAKGTFEVEFACGTRVRVCQAALVQVVNALRRPC
jgi:transposase-like protein